MSRNMTYRIDMRETSHVNCGFDEGREPFLLIPMAVLAPTDLAEAYNGNGQAFSLRDIQKNSLADPFGL